MKKILLTNLILSFSILLGLNMKVHGQAALSVSGLPEGCPNQGTLQFSVTGAPQGSTVSYQIWENTQSIASAVITTQNSLTGLSAGQYYIKASISIGQNINELLDSFVILNTQNPLDFSFSFTNAVCPNSGSITVNVTNGNASSFEIIRGPQLRPQQVSNSFNNLPVGQYLIKVNDANCPGIARSKSATIVGPNNVFRIVKEGWLNRGVLPSCNESRTRSVEVEVGNVFPYTLYWIYTRPNATTADTIIRTINTSYANLTSSFPFFLNQNYTVNQIIVDGCGAVKNNSNFSVEGSQLNLASFDVQVNGATCATNGVYLSIYPTNFVPPFSLSFTSYPIGFDPLVLNPNYLAPSNTPIVFGSATQSVPAGSYEFTITDACGQTANFTRTLTISTNGVVGLGMSPTDGCGRQSSTVYFWLSGNPTRAVVVGADPSVRTQFEALYGPIPYDISNLMYTAGSQSRLMIALPTAGYANPSQTSSARYQIRWYNDCGFFESDFRVKGYVPNNNVVITEGCTTFDITTPPVAVMNQWTYFPQGEMPWVGSAGLNNYYYLQSLDPITGEWKHPNTGIVYNPNLDNLAQAGLLLAANAVTPNLTYTGTMRVVFRYYLYGLNQGPSVPCVTELRRFDITPEASFTSHVYGCTNTTVNIQIVATSSHAPLTYSIIEKNGQAYVVNNNTNPVFSNLEVGIYKVQVTDICLNQTIRLIDARMAITPPIVPSNICDGQTATLSVNTIPGYTYRWYEQSTPAITLGTTSVLSFTNFTHASDAGNYFVEIQPSDLNCTPTLLGYEIPSTAEGPNPGAGFSTVICGANNRGIFNMFDYLGGDYDEYGTWTELTNSGTLSGYLWDNTNISEGIYIFEYTVPGSTCFASASTLVVFQIDDDCIPLNVDFTNFSVRKMGNNGHLNWVVASEKSTKGYYVEKSLDGQKWETLSFVPSQAPNGVSNHTLEYQFVDKTLQKGYNFYRIKHIDLEEKHKYSPIKYLKVETINAISIHPNPAVDAINIKGLSEGNLLIIHNIVGKKIHESTANAASIRINTQQYQPGIYVLTIIDEQGISSTHKIVIKD